MEAIKIILNPVAGRGYGARSEKTIRRYLEAEGAKFDLILTERPRHAVEIAREAACAGYTLVVAAGGDGTTNEVVNGLLAASREGAISTLGLLPVGSGSDFANNVGVPADLRSACQKLVRGQTRLVDICRVTVDGEHQHYFDNTVNVGFGGIVTLEALKVKWVRGLALYLPVVLKTIFLTRAPRVMLEYDGQKVDLPAAMICVGNGAREGGGFYCTPTAQPDDGVFDVCVVREIGKIQMLSLVPHFMKGSHVNHEPVTMIRTSRLVVSSPDNLIAHMDGEMLCTEAHRLEFDLLPRRLQVRC